MCGPLQWCGVPPRRRHHLRVGGGVLISKEVPDVTRGFYKDEFSSSKVPKVEFYQLKRATYTASWKEMYGKELKT